jgi:DNA-binding transcriptional LysR family regulator
MPQNLDIDILRTLATAYRLGSFNRAAEALGRSQSAISQQIHKLEDRVGHKLFRKRGRGLELTESGEVLLGYARRILELNDEAIASLAGASVAGSVRIGLPGDFAEKWLPAILGRFKRAHPTVHVEAAVDKNMLLVERLGKGKIDLALLLGAGNLGGAEVLATLPMAWIGAPGMLRKKNEPVPLVLFEQPCQFRAAAIAALDVAKIPWRIEFTSPSLAGLWAAAEAGLGVTVRTTASIPPHLADIGKACRLPKLPSVQLGLHSGSRPLSQAASRLRDVLFETLPIELVREGGAVRKKWP